LRGETTVKSMAAAAAGESALRKEQAPQPDPTTTTRGLPDAEGGGAYSG
jgi:hypothetical protein